MPAFAYEGKTPSGEIRKGKIDAPSQDAARAQLRKMNINPTSVSTAGFGNIEISFMKPKVTNKDLVLFTRQFATMIDSGLPLVQCLDIQAKQAANPTFRNELGSIKEAVESGSTFADALKRFPDTFDDLYRNMVAAGEVGGILDTILNRLSVYLEKAEKLKRQIKGAMMYPVITMIVAFVVVTILLVFVVPQFEQMFADMGGSLPAPTQFVINLSQWLQANILYIILGIVAVIFTLKFVYGTEKGRVIIDKILLKLPVFGDLLVKVAVARFCRTMGTMLSSGVSILEGLDICSRTAGNKIIEGAINAKNDKNNKIKLGNVNIKRDWGWAEEYVEAMQIILNCNQNNDYVICTGRLTSLIDFIDITYSKLNLNWKDHVVIDNELKRKNEISHSFGDPKPLEKDLQWKAKFSIDKIITALLESKLKNQ